MKSKKKPNWAFLFFISMVLLTFVWFMKNAYTPDKVSKRNPTTAYTPLPSEKPHKINPAERPNVNVNGFIYDGSINDALEELQITGEVLLCQDKDVCGGLYHLYRDVFSKELGKANIVNIGNSTASGWKLLDGTEIILIFNKSSLKLTLVLA